MYAQTEILRKGNERLLDNLQEGVVIVEESSNRVSFTNKSARGFKRQQMQSVAFDLEQQDHQSHNEPSQQGVSTSKKGDYSAHNTTFEEQFNRAEKLFARFDNTAPSGGRKKESLDIVQGI